MPKTFDQATVANMVYAELQQEFLSQEPDTRYITSTTTHYQATNGSATFTCNNSISQYQPRNNYIRPNDAIMQQQLAVMHWQNNQ